MAAEEPIVLPLGTEVSAKYRGAFCEAKIKKIIKCVKCRVTVKDTNQHLNILDDDIKGIVKSGSKVEIKHPESGLMVEATINKVTDSSTYTVVFDDGDENTLRRTQLCLKGEKHFVKSETLDQLPLTHPEHFGTPVMKSGKGFKRRREKNDSDSESDDESDSDSPPKKRTYKGRLQDMVGKVVLMETEDRKRTYWVPTLVVSPNANDLELKHADHLLLKSFKDSKFYAVAKKDLKDFTKDHATKNDDKTIKAAMDKALTFFENKDLPTNWDKEELLGSDTEESEEDSELSDNEPNEEKDRFVAQLFKFMDDRGTPINKDPSIGNRELDLYRVFRVVQNLGGYNKVTNQMKWRTVYNKMGLPPTTTASNQIKSVYKKYLHAFEDFYRKLGSTMGTISRPGRSRNNSGRSLLSFRERESPKSPRTEQKRAVKEEKETPVKEESDADSESPRKGRSGARGKEDSSATPTTRKAIKDDANKTSVSKDNKAAATLKESAKSTPIQKDAAGTKIVQKDTGKMSVQKDSPAKGDKNKQEDKKKIEKLKEVKKEEEKLKTPKEEDGKKKKATKKDAKKGKDVESASWDGDASDESEAESAKETSRRESRRQLDMVPDYPAGSRLKIKYGKGKNQKLYEAKVMKAEPEGSSMHYLVHYAGWNVRYDEWITKDRIMSVVELGKPGSVERQTSKTGVVPVKTSTKSPLAAPIVSRKKSAITKPGTPPPAKGQNQELKSKMKSPPGRPTRSTSQDLTRTPPPASKRRTRKGSGFGASQISESESEMSDDEITDKIPAMHPKNKDEQRVRREDETPSPYSFTKSDIDQFDMEENEETMAAFKAREELLEKESTNSVKDAAMEKLVADVLDDETKSDELGFDIKSSEDEEKMEVNLDIDKFLEEMDEADKEMPIVGELGLQAMDQVKVTDQPSPVSTVRDQEETPKKKVEKTPKGKKKETPSRGRKKQGNDLSAESGSDSPAACTTPAKVQEKVTVTPVKVENAESKKSEPEIKITSPEIHKEIKIELEDVKKMEKDETKKKKEKVKKEETSDKVEKEDKKVEKGKGKGKKKKEVEEKEIKDDSDSEKKPEKKVESEKKKTKKKVKKKQEENQEIEVAEPVITPDEKSKQDDSEETLKPEDSFTEVIPTGEIDSSKPQADVSSPKPAAPVDSSQEPKEVPGQSPKPNKDTPKLEETVVEPVPETSTSSQHTQAASINLPSVPPHSSAVFDPMALLAHVSSTAQAAATNTVFQNTPPDTPDRSPHVLSHGGLSPEQDSHSLGDDGDAGLESGPMTEGRGNHLPHGGESPTTCDTSTLSNGSSAGSSGNLPSSESGTEAAPTSNTAKRKSTAAEEEEDEEENDLKPAKKKRRGHKRQSHGTAGQSDKCRSSHRHIHSMSDSDEQGNSPHHRSDYNSPAKRSTASSLPPRPPRPPKYNFNIEEGSQLEGEDRIKFLVEKIGEIRKIYMNLKSEVAVIDRKRKRHRRKEKEVAAVAAAHAAVAAVASQSPARIVEARS